MDISADAQRQAFSLWLRTGRLPGWLKAVRAEFKFNPWHDPDDGRFTHAGTGRYFGRGSGRAAEAPGTARHSDDRRRPGPSRGGRGAGQGQGPTGGGGWGGKEPFGGYGGGRDGFRGGGASGSWAEPEADAPPKRNEARPVRRDPQPATQPQPQPQPQPAGRDGSSEKDWEEVRQNGYVWKIDTVGRPREVTGTITFSEAPRRSRTVQAQAGGADRRPSDDGGHYIAARFNGPAEAFNHFAQDANFNRGKYRALEDQWARSTRDGKRVDVRIVPVYEGSSQRPTMINVFFWTNGRPDSLQLPNEPTEKPRVN